MKRKIAFIIICLSVVFSNNIFAQRGEKAMGIMGGFNTQNTSGVAGIYFQYRFSKYFRLSPDFQYSFQHNGIKSFAFNGNAHFPLALDTKLNFYPLVGITYQSWSNNQNKNEGERSETFNRFGGNVGAGFEYMATPTLKISVEGKYSLIKSYPSAVFTLGLGYLF